MEHSAISPRTQASPIDASDLREAPRFTLLVRAAKLVSSQGEFVCVIRDVSETGVSVRLFHRLPSDDLIELHMPGGGTYQIRSVWERDNQAGFEFVERVDIARLIHEADEYPKRGLRLGVCFPIVITALDRSCEAIVENLSQQGAKIECEQLFAIDQALLIQSDDFAEVRAKVRWRRNSHYGLVFDDTLTLGDFARLAAKLQAPALLMA
ncbi:PilZ domain-containing protein [Erythrobacter rubeus]|uniref:PilZ domain-containing protein n=1 Tax=Erythrobacter rubeus TaxID=2760803 RepID=A0ABR8KU22_9SPHN|nr:PilZ domain-containing protein [Erythrobacter rubeus]MBD2843090.1 PilZ domain-containing protein [Erythrobacter rubeus]